MAKRVLLFLVAAIVAAGIGSALDAKALLGVCVVAAYFWLDNLSDAHLEKLQELKDEIAELRSRIPEPPSEFD